MGGSLYPGNLIPWTTAEQLGYPPQTVNIVKAETINFRCQQ